MAKKGLGRGLGSLFGVEEEELKSVQDEKSEYVTPPSSTPTESMLSSEKTDTDGVKLVRLNLIDQNLSQPRKYFDEEKIKTLSESIKRHGLVQPIIVSRLENGRYMIIAGERRWRAAKMAGMKEIPAIVRDYEERTAAEIALIENLQREDLNPIEEARGYHELMKRFDMTQEDISRRIGKSRSAVANSIRLLSLGKYICRMVAKGDLSAGHARTILPLEDADRRALADRIVAEGLSVRQTEQLVKEILYPDPPEEKPPVNEQYELELERISEGLATRLGTKVSISHGKTKGKIEIEYYSDDDLERLVSLLTQS